MLGLGWVGLGWVGLICIPMLFILFSQTKIKCTTHGGVAAIIKVVCFHTQSSSRVPQRRNMSRQLHSTIRRRSMHGLASGETTALIVLKTKISKSRTKLNLKMSFNVREMNSLQNPPHHIPIYANARDPREHKKQPRHKALRHPRVRKL